MDLLLAGRLCDNTGELPAWKNRFSASGTIILFYPSAKGKPASGRMSLPDLLAGKGSSDNKKYFTAQEGQKRRDLWSIQSS